MKSLNFKMVLNNVSQLKYIQLTKHMRYCIQKTLTTCTIQHSGMLSF